MWWFLRPLSHWWRRRLHSYPPDSVWMTSRRSMSQSETDLVRWCVSTAPFWTYLECYAHRAPWSSPPQRLSLEVDRIHGGFAH